VRSTNNPADAVFNADVLPTVSGLPAGKLRVRVILDYWPAFLVEGRGTRRASRTQVSSTTVFDDGKMMVVSDTTDPASNRRVRVEVTATILK
jgi:hypothetical protein